MRPVARPSVPGGRPDIILRNGNVITVDARRPRAEALAIADGKVQAVGNNDEIRRLAGQGTEEIDLAGRTVVPGFIDSHAHAAHIGHNLSLVDLSRSRSISDVLAAVAARAQTTPPGEWIEVSGMWHESALAEKRLPTRRELDSVAPDHPVYLPRGTRFFAVANSVALARAGIDERTPEPEGGEFRRDPATGELTGLLVNKPAFSLVKQHLPVPGPEQKRHAIRFASRLFSRVGVTSLVDPALDLADMRAYQDVWSDGDLLVRTNMTYILDMNVPLVLSEEELLRKVTAWGPYSGYGDAMLRLGAMKLFVDGFVETAWLKDGYANDSSFHGTQAIPRDTFEKMVRAANRNGWQIGVHCVGDAAIDCALDVFEAAHREQSIVGRRWSLMHALFPSADTFERVKRLGVVISAQQQLIYAFAPSMLTCWGEERVRRASPHRDWLDRGVIVAGGTDVVPFDPLTAIWSEVTRGTLAAGVVGPEQRITREEALRLHTLNGAYLTFEEELKGSLEPGKLADLVVLDGDLLTCGDDELKDLRVATTVVGGRVVYSDGQVWGDRMP